MEIVIAGGGKVGETISEELAREGNDIVLIEIKAGRLEQIINKIDITGLAGDGAEIDNLVEAGVQDCDMFIAVTAEDETNIISAIIAKELGAKYTIARVRDPKYTNHIEFVRESLGINMVINPELEAARHISRILEYPETLRIEQFEKGRVSMVELVIKENGPLIDTPLVQFRENYGDVLICAITRDYETIIPSGDTVLRKGDHLYVTGAQSDISRFYQKAGYKEEKIDSTLIIGGGGVTYNLLNLLKDKDMDIKVIEIKEEKAIDLSYEFPDVVVIKGDGTDQDFLDEERIRSFDSVLSLTGIDEENIVNSLYALSIGINKVITKVSRTGLLKILGNIDLQSIVTPKQLITNKILRFVRSISNTTVSNVEELVRIADNEVETLQFLVKATSRVVGVKLKDLDTKDELLVAYIIRGDDLIYPSGEDEILEGDHVLIVTKHKSFDDIDDILK
ncbi:MAG TPA: Trk system potassium transporter TrkA [Atopostipes sp.]|nr:Trk system potassium transporter TrkA [Atopostipes sp.]